LFTDIKGSTLLLERLDERNGAVPRRHRDLLAVAFAIRGGGVVEADGVALFVAFGKPALDGRVEVILPDLPFCLHRSFLSFSAACGTGSRPRSVAVSAAPCGGASG